VGFGTALAWELALPEQFDDAGRFVRPDDVRGSVHVSADLHQHLAWLQDYAALGFDRIYLHHVGQEQREFIETFGERVLPELR
jgi:hypothetical protein